MERIHMNHLLDLIHRLRAGESERRIARDLGLSRPTVHKYRELAEAHGYLKPGSPMPDAATLRAVLGPDPQPPRRVSSVEPYRDLVQRLVDQQVEMTAIYQQLRDDYEYTGSYSAVRRFVHQLCPHNRMRWCGCIRRPAKSCKSTSATSAGCSMRSAVACGPRMSLWPR